MESFGDFIGQERQRLSDEREQIRGQMRELDTKLAEIDREFAAINAYEAAKTGRASVARQQGAPRARKGSKREAILEALRATDGMSRGDLLRKLGLHQDKAAESSVSNALTNLTKIGHVRREGGRYYVA